MTSCVPSPKQQQRPDESIETRVRELIDADRLVVTLTTSSSCRGPIDRERVIQEETVCLSKMLAQGVHGRELLLDFPNKWRDFEKHWTTQCPEGNFDAGVEEDLMRWCGQVLQRTAYGAHYYTDALQQGLSPLDEAARDAAIAALQRAFWLIPTLFAHCGNDQNSSPFIATRTIQAASQEPCDDLIKDSFNISATTRIIIDILQAMERLDLAQAGRFLRSINPLDEPFFDKLGRHCRNSIVYNSALAAGADDTETETLTLEYRKEIDPFVINGMLFGLADHMRHPLVKPLLAPIVCGDWTAGGVLFDRILLDWPLDELPTETIAAIRRLAWGDRDTLLELAPENASEGLFVQRTRALLCLLNRRTAQIEHYKEPIGPFEARMITSNREYEWSRSLFGEDRWSSVAGWSPWLETRALVFRPTEEVPLGRVVLDEFAGNSREAQVSVGNIAFRTGLPLAERRPLFSTLLLAATGLLVHRGEGRAVRVTLPLDTYYRFGGGDLLAGFPLQHFLAE